MAANRVLACLMLVACMYHVANANDMYIRATVLDCDNSAVTTAFVSVFNCTDKAGSSDIATMPETSKAIQQVNSLGYAGSTITENMYCPDEWGVPQNNGLKVDYCSGSSQNGCGLAVMKYDNLTGTYKVDPAYAPLSNIFNASLQAYARFTNSSTNATQPLYQTIAGIPNEALPEGSPLPCPGPFPACSYPVFEFKPTSCPKPPPPPPTQCTDKCLGLPKVPGSCKPVQAPGGETAYAVMCALDGSSTTPPNTTSPSFLSFSSRQPVYASNPPLFTGTQPSNWGWMGQWPKNYTVSANYCNVTGKIYAGRKYLAGFISASLQVFPDPAGPNTGNKEYRLTYTLKVYPNRLEELHIYFACTPLPTNAPGQFGNQWQLGGVQEVTQTVKAVCPEDTKVDPVLYTAVHMVLN